MDPNGGVCKGKNHRLMRSQVKEPTLYIALDLNLFGKKQCIEKASTSQLTYTCDCVLLQFYTNVYILPFHTDTIF